MGESGLTRDEAIFRIEGALRGRTFLDVAREYGIQNLPKPGLSTFNKGWAGHLVEAILGKSPDSSSDRDFGDWELKVSPVKMGIRPPNLCFKEQITVTNIKEADIVHEDFYQSHLIHKASKMLIVTRFVEQRDVGNSWLYETRKFDLYEGAPEFSYAFEDYKMIQEVVRTRGYNELTRSMPTKMIEPVPHGLGHGSKTRAYGIKKSFLNEHYSLNFRQVEGIDKVNCLKCGNQCKLVQLPNLSVIWHCTHCDHSTNKIPSPKDVFG